MWNERFLKLAEHISTWSKDPSHKCGAVIVDSSNRVISLGFNGLPSGIQDSVKLLNNRTIKLQVILHAEENAILFAQCPLKKHIIYTYPFAPCAKCASYIIQAGICKVIAPSYIPEKWKDNVLLGKSLLQEAGVEYVII